MRWIYFAILVLIIAGCASDRHDQLVTNPDRPDMVSASTENADLNASMEKARASVDTFIKRVHSAKSDEKFSIKVPLATPDHSVEHIWVTGLSYADGKFKGVISDEPFNLPNYKKGSPVTVGKGDISDWLIYSHGKYEGGYSEDVLLKQDGQPPLPR